MALPEQQTDRFCSRSKMYMDFKRSTQTKSAKLCLAQPGNSGD